MAWVNRLGSSTTEQLRDGAITSRELRPCVHGRGRGRVGRRRSALMLRGELWWADLGLPRGLAPALRRPVVIVGSDKYNRSNLRTVTVATVTTNEQLAALPGNVAIPADVAGLEADSVLNVTQIATVERIGAVPDWLMAQIDTGLARALALAHL
jgi:mRNA interferase MazF